jgi:hypothetical protein
MMTTIIRLRDRYGRMIRVKVCGQQVCRWVPAHYIITRAGRSRVKGVWRRLVAL